MASTDIRDGVSEGAALVRLEKQENKIGAGGARGRSRVGASRYFISYFIFKKP